MKQSFFLLLLLLPLAARASQIVVGLRSDNLVAWSLWERAGKERKQYLLVQNKSPQEVALTIRLKRFIPMGPGFKEVKTTTVFHTLRLAGHQVVRLPHPQAATQHDYLEFVENHTSIGLLTFNTPPPPK